MAIFGAVVLLAGSADCIATPLGATLAGVVKAVMDKMNKKKIVTDAFGKQQQWSYKSQFSWTTMLAALCCLYIKLNV